MSRSPLLSNYPALHTRDPETLRDRLFRDFGATSFAVASDPGRFKARLNHLQIAGLGLSYGDYAGDISLEFRESSHIRQIFSIDGAGRYCVGNQAGEITKGSWTPVLPAFTPFRVEYKSRYRELAVRISFDALSQHLSALLGIEIGQKLVFDRTGTRNPAISALRRRIFQFSSDFNERGTCFSDLAAAELARMVIIEFLMAQRHNYTHLLLRKPLLSSSSAVRIVEEFVEANWDRPIDINAMSAVAKVSARSLFRQFKKDRGCSPADFAKRIRLHRAQQMLEQSREGTSVTQTALKCGFQNPGHFARDFRLAFGELPSETLKRSSRSSQTE